MRHGLARRLPKKVYDTLGVPVATCPNCGTTLKEDYGMSQCSNCGVFSFIDMDGNAFINEAGAVDEATTIEITRSDAKMPAVPPEEPASDGAGEIAFEFPDPVFENLPESAPSLPESEPTDQEAPTSFESDSGGEPPAPVFEQSFEPPENPGEQEFAPISFDIELPANPAEMAIPDLGPADDPLGLEKFANSEMSSAKDGPLLFRIVVSGIDSKEMRETIREVLEDPRFGWDADQMFARLEKGVLTIENLSPVKASILVTRIKRLPVKIRWEQYAITQADSSP